MKKVFLVLAACAIAMLQSCGGKTAETFSEKKVVEDGGTGPYKAIMVTEPGLDAHTIFRPEDLSPFGKKNPLPVLVWGNGACTNSPWEHQNFLSEIASHGFIVVATGYMPEEGKRNYGPQSTSAQQIESIDWAIGSMPTRRALTTRNSTPMRSQRPECPAEVSRLSTTPPIPASRPS